MKDSEQKLHFEVTNMFRITHRLVSGQIVSFVPFLYTEGCTALEKNFLSKEKICAANFFTTVSDDDATTFVLSDGMGSGVKANILATLTAKNFSHHDGQPSVHPGQRYHPGPDSAGVQRAQAGLFHLYSDAGASRLAGLPGPV